MLLTEARDAVAMAAEDPADLRTWKLAPLYRHVKKIRPEEVAYEGWKLLASIELQRGERKAAFEAWRQARPAAGVARLADLATVLGNAAWDARDDLRVKDKRLMLQVAEDVVEHFEANPVPVVPNVPPGDEDLVQDLPSALELLARALHVNGRRAKALAALERAIELAPERVYYDDRRAELERR